MVDSQSKNLKLNAPVNEYVKSLPGLLVYHSEKYHKNCSARMINVVPQLDSLMMINQPEIDKVNVTGMVAQVKVDETMEDATNESFYDMFGQGVDLAM